MKKYSMYSVVFSYSIEVRAQDEGQAYDLAVAELQNYIDDGYLESASDMAYTVENVEA